MLSGAQVIIRGFDCRGTVYPDETFVYQDDVVEEFEYAIERYKEQYPKCVRIIFDIALTIGEVKGSA